MSTRPYRFLLAMWEGGGTVPPELGVARRLVERGHHVHVLADPTIRERAEAAGCGFTPWRDAPHRTSLDPAQDLFKDWEVNNPLTMLRNAVDGFMAGPAGAFADETVEAIASVTPDALIADGMMLGPIIAGQASRLPVAVVMPNIWMVPTRGVPAVGPGFAPAKSPLGHARDAVMRAIAGRVFNRGLPALNSARARHGLDPLDSLWDQVRGADRILMLTSAAFDFASPKVPPSVTYVGPILDDPDWAEPWTPPWPSGNHDPLVLVAFTSNYQDHAPQLRRVVDALSSLPVRAVVTLGQMLDSTEVESTDNVAVVGSAPHSSILDDASVVVTHCGHGTTLKALAAGVPMVCMPMGRDQNDTAARVAYHGAGIRLSPRSNAGKIRAAVTGVLDDPGYRAGAQRLRAAIRDEQRHVDVVDELESLVATATPAV